MSIIIHAEQIMNYAMVVSLLKRFIGSSNERIVKKLFSLVAQINALESSMQQLRDDDFPARTKLFKERYRNGESLDSMLPEAFALVREASRRVLNMRHFDVQLVGGMVLHQGRIAEMKTGEGKTLVATLAVYLNAITEKGVHVITVNDYLARRDSEWMGRLYKFLGLSIGCITNSMSDADRQAAYKADITYGTNNEFGFDYLRDNLKYSTSEMVQRPFHFAIVDEVDSILIDEARTPLVISGPTDDNTELYNLVDKLIPKLVEGDYELDEKNRAVSFTDAGSEHIEQLLKSSKIIPQESFLYDLENMTIVHHINQGLRAHKLFKRDVDYIVKDGKLMIIDEFTGRILEGRRYSEGLHQALEAKEGLRIQNENQTVASVTFQNYFRMYPKLAGMTGTAMTEAQEFADIYKLEVVAIPTNVTVTRRDQEDQVYISLAAKDNAVVKEIQAAHHKGQPILVGTVSIERSEYLSALLKKHGIKHQVLNARFHEQEAEIIAQAGRVGAVTIATNMAGRGTDIMLGGNAQMLLNSKIANSKKATPELIAKWEQEIITEVEDNKAKVRQLGGLLVIGTERHESRRIDNQLRGRAGRQGDPGRTVFYLSLEDDLMRIFGTDKLKGVFTKMGLKDDEVVEAKMLSRSIEKAQLKIEARNYEIRKNLLRFDDVMNDQRKVIYSQRKFIMNDQEVVATVKRIALEIADELLQKHMPEDALPEQWDLKSLQQDFLRVYALHLDLSAITKGEVVEQHMVQEFVHGMVNRQFDSKVERYGASNVAMAFRHMLLLTLDFLWKDHLHKLDHLRTGIGLRAYAQKDPLNEYKMEAFNMFGALLEEIAEVSITRTAHLEMSHTSSGISRQFAQDEVVDLASTVKFKEDKGEDDWSSTPRNSPCPCGSGKKYKHCHGAVAV